MEKAARTLGLKPQSLEVSNAASLETAFKTLQATRAEALIVDTDPITLTHRALIADVVARARVPAVYGQHDFVEVGGLMAYGPNFREIYRLVGRCVGKILQGARPADLPVEQPTLLALVINLRTAKALGLTMPPSVLLRAEVVE